MWAFQNQTNKIEGQGMTVEIDNKDKKINIYILGSFAFVNQKCMKECIIQV